MITRVFSVNNEFDWGLCKSVDISYISVDKIKNHSWAKVDDSRITVRR